MSVRSSIVMSTNLPRLKHHIKGCIRKYMAQLNFSLDIRRQLESLSLSENDIHEVFNNGEHVKTSKGNYAARKYYPSYGYEIWATYKPSKFGNGYLITWVWKTYSKR